MLFISTSMVKVIEIKREIIMEIQNHFLLDEDDYVRDLDITGHYKEQSALYLSKMSGKSIEEARTYVETATQEKGELPITDSHTLFLSKETHGNREKMVLPFTKYLEAALNRNCVISPTMAAYLSPHEKESLLAKYIKVNIDKRYASKKEKFIAQVAGDKEEESFKDNEQSSFKIKNNALSGAHASKYTILFNKSSHSTLTSTCRTSTGYANANNEKFICGNRHYWKPEIVKSNILSIISLTDLELLSRAMEKFGIRFPTSEETMECIHYSTKFYWRNDQELDTIRELVEKLDPIERAAFVYVGDLYHLAKYNDAVVRNFIDLLSQPASEPIPMEEADTWIKALDDDYSALIKYLCIDEVNRRSMDKVKEESPLDYQIVGATAKRVQSILDDYKLMIKALWTTQNMPASVAMIPTAIRRGAVASDTDSTIFTVQNWIEWFSGDIVFDKKSNAVRDVMGFFSSRTVTHILAMVSTQMGIVKENRFMIQMKNEFTFPVFTLTSRSKHYYAYKSAQEGNVYSEMDLELKGVALRSSNSPIHIREKTKQFIETNMKKIIDGKKLNARSILAEVAQIEHEIIDHVSNGGCDYYKTGQIKPADSYKNPNSSPYQNYVMWEEVFADSYGHTEPPTYTSFKISVEGDNKTKMEEWYSKMDDGPVKDKLKAYLESVGKHAITTLVVPEQVVRDGGVPKEIVVGVNIRKLVNDVMEPLYLTLESLGLYMQNPNITRLVSDYYLEPDLEDCIGQ